MNNVILSKDQYTSLMDSQDLSTSSTMDVLKFTKKIYGYPILREGFSGDAMVFIACESCGETDVILDKSLCKSCGAPISGQRYDGEMSLDRLMGVLAVARI